MPRDSGNPHSRATRLSVHSLNDLTKVLPTRPATDRMRPHGIRREAQALMPARRRTPTPCGDQLEIAATHGRLRDGTIVVTNGSHATYHVVPRLAEPGLSAKEPAIRNRFDSFRIT